MAKTTAPAYELLHPERVAGRVQADETGAELGAGSLSCTKPAPRALPAGFEFTKVRFLLSISISRVFLRSLPLPHVCPAHLPRVVVPA